MTEPSVSFAGNLTDDPELRHTVGGIARAMFRVACHFGPADPLSAREAGPGMLPWAFCADQRCENAGRG